MRVAKACVRTIEIPFVVEFRHFLASRQATHSLVLELVCDSNLRGYGECTPRDYVSGETIASTAATLKQCLEELRRVAFDGVADIRRYLDTMEQHPEIRLDKHPNARCALELALLDALAKEQSTTIARLLGGLQADTLNYSGVLSLGRSRLHTQMLDQIKMFGFQQVKIKVGKDTERDLENVRFARAELGNDIEIRIDANGAWTLDEAVRNCALYGPLSITTVEQPLPAVSREVFPTLVNEVGPQVEITIDESLLGMEEALWFVHHHGASGFNLKVSKLGGLLRCLEILEVAEKAGIKCRLGCHVGETSILTAAGMILAGLSGTMHAHEGAFGKHLLSWDIVHDPLQFQSGGRVDIASSLQRNGLGIEVDKNLLEKSTRSGEWL